MRDVTARVLATLLLFGCGNEVGEPIPGQAEAAPPSVPLLRCNSVFGTQPVVQVGSSGGQDGDVWFERVSDALFLPDGGLAVADARQHVIWILNSLGVARGKLGRPGQGPGEFSHLVSIHLLGPDVLAGYESTGTADRGVPTPWLLVGMTATRPTPTLGG